MYTSTRQKLNKNVSYCITKGISDDGGLFILDNFDGFSFNRFNSIVHFSIQPISFLLKVNYTQMLKQNFNTKQN